MGVLPFPPLPNGRILVAGIKCEGGGAGRKGLPLGPMPPSNPVWGGPWGLPTIAGLTGGGGGRDEIETGLPIMGGLDGRGIGHPEGALPSDGACDKEEEEAGL